MRIQQKNNKKFRCWPHRLHPPQPRPGRTPPGGREPFAPGPCRPPPGTNHSSSPEAPRCGVQRPGSTKVTRLLSKLTFRIYHIGTTKAVLEINPHRINGGANRICATQSSSFDNLEEMQSFTLPNVTSHYQ
eukprot:scaffold479149_cov23-Prasinocladus_malaysianus.AAC.1